MAGGEKLPANVDKEPLCVPWGFMVSTRRQPGPDVGLPSHLSLWEEGSRPLSFLPSEVFPKTICFCQGFPQAGEGEGTQGTGGGRQSGAGTQMESHAHVRLDSW